ncbi:MAG TPA: YicC family protein [Spirochaetales bacterium]|nr:YicC family protein [Spirochaetales bacterium]HRZ63833.1 YicC family protein [Spirochaetia bacterium]
MIKSMTGFAQREIETGSLRGSIGIKSYNNRYLDLSISLPPYFARLEPRFRDYLAGRVVHGKVEAWLRVRGLDLPVRASADLGAARAVAGVLREISEACGLSEPLRLSNILSFDGVVAYEREVDEDATWALLEPELGRCFAEYEEARLREGEATRADIAAQLERVSRQAESVRSRLPEIEATIRGQLQSRFKEALGEAVDEQRILAETASLLMKYTVNEELARLSAHISSFARIADSEAAPGKKLDFLCQEMNREVNTIGSKSMLLPVSQAVVELKDALENIREQLRNIE